MPAPITINLLPQHVMRERRVTKILNWSLTYGRYIIIFTELIVLIAFFSRFRLDQELTDLHESIKQKQMIITSVSEFENEVRRLQDRLDRIDELSEEHTLYTDAISLLEEIVPLDVILTKLNFSGIEVSLSGAAYSKIGFSQLVKNLKRSDKIQHIVIETIDKPEDSSDPLTFSMKFNLVP